MKYKTCIYILIVCLDIQLNIIGETKHENSTFLKEAATVRWKLGTCTSLNSIEEGTTYQYPALYTEHCCLGPGRHTLVCYNNPPTRGWNDAYIIISGHQYCNDFNSYKSFQKIFVTDSTAIVDPTFDPNRQEPMAAGETGTTGKKSRAINNINIPHGHKNTEPGSTPLTKVDWSLKSETENIS